MTPTTKLTIQQYILLLRGCQVILDRDLAKLYNVDTKVLNQAVKRNIDRFPEEFRFQLNKVEFIELVTNCDRFNILKHSKNLPFVYTEQGVAMLSAVLRSSIAVQVSVQIMKAFVTMRHQFLSNQELMLRINNIEIKQQFTDEKVNQLFQALNSESTFSQGIFYKGQVFDAYKFSLDIIRSAKHSIILIDNYVDENTLMILSHRNKNVTANIYTEKLNHQLQMTLMKFHEQYPAITVEVLKNCHDRFLIIDKSELFHLGASIKDLGKKIFAFSKINDVLPELLNKLKL